MSKEIKDILKERGDRYGSFDTHAKISQDIKECMYLCPNWDVLDPDMKECLEMVAHKIARILNGNPHYEDSWRDIAGYSTLVADRLLK